MFAKKSIRALVRMHLYDMRGYTKPSPLTIADIKIL